MNKFTRLETASVLSIAAIFTGLALGIFVGPVQGAPAAQRAAEAAPASVVTTATGEGRFKVVVTARRLAPANP